MSKPKLVIVGGFLGAGKTTLLWKVLEKLRSRNIETGLITNDQAPELVDTEWLSRGQSHVREVAGSCFCCNFSGFDSAINSLLERNTKVILAEPVGSCTDLSATILQPVKRLRSDLELTQFSVVLDPERAREALGQKESALHPDALYILRLQLAEADIILLNKIDSMSPNEADSLAAEIGHKYSQAHVHKISAKTGAGVEAWLDEVLEKKDIAGRTIVEVDYDRYAEGEAVLGWLNLTASADSALTDGKAYLSTLLCKLDEKLKAGKFSIGHVKMMLAIKDKMWIGNIVHETGGISVREAEGIAVKDDNRLTVNARVGCSPDELSKMVDDIMKSMSNSELQILHHHCLKPGFPTPTYRDTKTVR